MCCTAFKSNESLSTNNLSGVFAKLLLSDSPGSILFNQYIQLAEVLNKPIKKVAVCGGSGSFLLKNAIEKKADILITSDFKYHQFFEGNNKILIADIGHYESEQFTIELISDLLIKKFINFAIRKTSVYTNPINYL